MFHEAIRTSCICY